MTPLHSDDVVIDMDGADERGETALLDADKLADAKSSGVTKRKSKGKAKNAKNGPPKSEAEVRAKKARQDAAHKEDARDMVSSVRL